MYYHPLRMERVLFTCKPPAQVRIALPVSVQIAIIQSRVAVEFGSIISGEASVAKGIPVGMPNPLLRRIRAPQKVPAPGRVTPGPIWIPVPRLNKQICVLPITDDAPACRQDLLDLIRPEEHIRRVAGNAVNRRAQGIKRAERVH